MTRHTPKLLPTLFFVALLGTVSSAYADAPPPPAVLVAVEGPVSWHGPGESAFVAAHGGEQLLSGAVVRTGIRGIARLRWRNGGEFKLMPLGQMDVSDPDGLKMESGQIWARFKEHLLAPFMFHSPSATAVIRGTILGVSVDGLGETRVSVFQGKVEVSDLRGERVLLTPGQAVDANPRGMGPVGPLTDDDREQNEFAPTSSNGTSSTGVSSEGSEPAAGSATTGVATPKADPNLGTANEHKDAPGANAARRPGDRPGTAMERTHERASLWSRFDDVTRRGFDWVDRNRASERLPMLRQEMMGDRVPVRSAGDTPAAGHAGNGNGADNGHAAAAANDPPVEHTTARSNVPAHDNSSAHANPGAGNGNAQADHPPQGNAYGRDNAPGQAGNPPGQAGNAQADHPPQNNPPAHDAPPAQAGGNPATPANNPPGNNGVGNTKGNNPAGVGGNTPPAPGGNSGNAGKSGRP